MEHLLLRHNGPGIKKSFILDAAPRLPMLRSISLDWCDSGEGEFDRPNVLTGQCENFKMQAPKMHIRLPVCRGSEEASTQGNPSTCVEQYQPPADSRERESYKICTGKGFSE